MKLLKISVYLRIVGHPSAKCLYLIKNKKTSSNISIKSGEITYVIKDPSHPILVCEP